MRYRIERRIKRGQWVWAILKDGQFMGSTLRYVQAFRIVNLLNENSTLTIAKVAQLQNATVRERGSRQFTRSEQRLLRVVGSPQQFHQGEI